MQLGARGAQRDRQATRKLRNYSKQWNPGDTMRCFIPLIWYDDGRPDFLIGQVWGHPVNDVKELGLHTTFIPSLTPFDSNGYPIGTPDITYQFSRVAPIFVNGMRAGEMARIAAKPWASDAQRETKLDEVKKKYDKTNPNRVQPIIGGAKFVIMSEVISIKYVENQGCVKDSCAMSSWAMSDKQLRQCFALMDNPKFTPQKGAQYFEFEITYPPDPEKSKSGAAAVPAGITPEYALCNKYPMDFQTVESYFLSWSTDSETIRQRATTSISADAIQDAIRNYCMVNSEFLDTLDNEDDIKVLTNNISVVSKVIAPKFLTNAELKATITEAIQKMEQAEPIPVNAALPAVDDTAVEPAPVTVTPTAPESAAPTAPEVDPLAGGVPQLDLAVNPEAPSLDTLLNSSAHFGGDQQDLLDNIDFGGIG